MPKAKLLSFLCALLMSIGMQAHDLEPLHVDGRYLKNPKGDIVTLHGWISNWGNFYFDIPEAGDNMERDFMLWKLTTDSILNSGWKMDYARFHFSNYETSPSDFDGFVRNNLFETYYLPRIDYLNSKGIYVVLMCDVNDNDGGYREIGDPLWQRLMKYWDYVSSHPRIKNNPGVMFELANEPGHFQGSDGSLNDFRTLKAYYQPMVDIIRNNGCQQIIWIPGSGCQWEYRGYASYPIEGGNIGYAVHGYDWFGGRDYDSIRKFWDATVKPASNMAPIMVTETSWPGSYGIFDGEMVEDPALTSDFGINLKRVMDELGNVSFNLLNPSVELANTGLPSETLSPSNDPEGPCMALKEWYKEYAKTKYASPSSLSATSVELVEAPSCVLPNKVIPLALMATFNDGRKWNVAGDAVWNSSDESVLVVNHGNIFVKSEGTATIHGQYTDGTGKAFNTQFTVQSQLFPLTQEGVENFFEATFDEATHTFSGIGDMGWAYTEYNPIDGISLCKSIDLLDYQYLVMRMNEPAAFNAGLRLVSHGGDEGEAFVDLAGKTEEVIDLHQLPNIDLTHIETVSFWVYESSLSVKEFFLSNDGVNPVRYVQSTTIKASDAAMRYGDEVPQLPYTVSGFAHVGTPKLTTTATKSSPVGNYNITAEAGSDADDDIRYFPGRMTVLPAVLSMTPGNAEMYEGEEIPSVNITYSGFRNGDTEGTAIATAPTTYTEATRHAPAGSYPIVATGGMTNGNYKLSCMQNGTLIIHEDPIDGTDLTARVGISQDNWHAWGTTNTQYAPAVKTKDGRTAQMTEVYEGTTETTGELMWQEVTGLPNGDYVVEVFANAVYTPNRGFDTSVEEGDEDVAYVEANGERTYVDVRFGESVPWNGFYRINTTVTDGKLRISMVAEKPGTNWHTIQIKRLVKLPETIVTADNKTMVYGDEVPELTYTTDGPALDGTPQLTTTATSASPVGTYPITVERGTETNERVVYVAGTLTITKAPLTVGAKDETITEGDAIPTFTLTYDGFRNNDNEATAFTTKPRATTTATSSSPAGSYPIKVSGGKAKNYELSYEQGTLTIVASAAPQDEDLTARVGTSQEAWNAWGVCATEFAPAITTNDGRQAQMMETYEETTENTGEMMHQTVTGLENGDYAVELYANAQYTDGRGFASDLKDGATDVVYVSANERRCYVKAHIGTAVSENGVYTVYAHVTDGTLRLGLTAEKPGTNWHTIQIKKLTLLRLGTVIYADDKTREQGQDNPKWTYVVSGADITGQPLLSCTARKQSPAGSYVIRVGKGTTKSDLPIYLQPGVLTVTVPTGIEEIGVDEANAPVYDLQGRRVEGAESGKLNLLRPGFYIRGGKIIHVKL
jgi:hypothetical protein